MSKRPQDIKGGSHIEPRSREELRGALTGAPHQRHALALTLIPVIHGRVARVLVRKRSKSKGRGLRQDIEDLTQDVLVRLFEDDSKILRRWNPQRGMSLRSYVGLVAERKVLGILRSRSRSPWTEFPEPGNDESLINARAVSIQGQIESSEFLEVMAERLTERITPLGMRVFKLLFVEQRTVKEVATQMQTTAGALYVWRNRLSRAVAEVRAELEEEGVLYGGG
ncbi:MAG: sigma-70 family RNA polymerase sigma factor [Myxococcota bacterium]